MTDDKPSPVEIAAKRWWRGKRPFEWDESAHLKDPAINCETSDETSLACAVARLVASEPAPEGETP
jgi:hypothetical protein